MGEKTDLQLTGGAELNQAALNETVNRINDQHYWLCAAVDPAINCLLHVRLYSTRITPVAEMFLAELRERHHVDDALFLVDSTPWL